MKRVKNKHLGSNFDDFLREEGTLEDTTAVAIKRVLAYQIQEEMKQRNLSKAVLAKKMKTSRSSVDRLLDPGNPSVTLQTLERAASALDKKLIVELA
jgi:predicted XRE-type DNA-binding protein